MEFALSLLAAVVCVAAALRGLARTIAPTSFDPVLIDRALAERRPLAPASDDAAMASGARLHALRKCTATLTPDTWERALFEAFLERNHEARDAAVNELLTELDGITERGARVPGACARIALSSGFLFATLSLLAAAVPAVGTGSLMLTLAPALNSLAVGIAAAAFCAAAQARSNTVRRRLRGAFDNLVITLQSCNLSESR